MLVQLLMAYLGVSERRQQLGTPPSLACAASLFVAAACGGRAEQVAPIGADDSGTAAEGGSAGAVARGGQPAEGGTAAASTNGAPGGSAAAGTTVPLAGAGGASVSGVSSGATAGAGGATGVLPRDLVCDPFGTWLVTYGDEPVSLGETRYCAPGVDELVVEPGATPGEVDVTFMGRGAGYSNCGDDVTFPTVEETSAAISADGCTLMATLDVSWCYSGEAQGETRSVSLTVAGDTASGVVDHLPRQCPACGGPTCPEVQFDATASRAPMGDPVLDACLEDYPPMQCEPDPMCMDGFNDIVLYPGSAGTFPLDHSAPPELLEVGVARYTNSVCACDASWSVNLDGVWVDVGPTTLCLAILEYDDECGGCLTEWMGGCC